MYGTAPDALPPQNLPMHTKAIFVPPSAAASPWRGTVRTVSDIDCGQASTPQRPRSTLCCPRDRDASAATPSKSAPRPGSVEVVNASPRSSLNAAASSVRVPVVPRLALEQRSPRLSPRSTAREGLDDSNHFITSMTARGTSSVHGLAEGSRTTAAKLPCTPVLRAYSPSRSPERDTLGRAIRSERAPSTKARTASAASLGPANRRAALRTNGPAWAMTVSSAGYPASASHAPIRTPRTSAVVAPASTLMASACAGSLGARAATPSRAAPSTPVAAVTGGAPMSPLVESADRRRRGSHAVPAATTEVSLGACFSGPCSPAAVARTVVSGCPKTGTAFSFNVPPAHTSQAQGMLLRSSSNQDARAWTPDRAAARTARTAQPSGASSHQREAQPVASARVSHVSPELGYRRTGTHQAQDYSRQAQPQPPAKPTAEVAVPRESCQSSSRSQRPALVECEPGAVVVIGGKKFEVLKAIGEGTFGVVWGARPVDNIEETEAVSIAIKEIVCESEQSLHDTVYECEILHDLRSVWGGADSNVGRIPSFVSCGLEYVSPKEWRVRLAMSRIPGESVNRFLDRRKREREAGLAEPMSRMSQFAEACRFARELVAQLAPAFARISTLAYHRDVNPRNILVEDLPGSARYGLIDFGLAVDATKWRVGETQVGDGEALIGTWQVFGVGGDCRYWPVSAWLMLERGPKVLSVKPQLCLEYKTHLDLHALGITALQVFADLSPILPENSEDCEPEMHVSRLALSIGAICDEWRRYWETVSGLWQRLFDAFRKSGDHHDLAVVKAEYRELAVHQRIGDHLRSLRTLVRECCEVCDDALPEPGLEGLPGLLQALLAMISSGEDSARSSWRRVELLIQPGTTANEDSLQQSRVEVPSAQEQHTSDIPDPVPQEQRSPRKSQHRPVRAADHGGASQLSGSGGTQTSWQPRSLQSPPRKLASQQGRSNQKDTLMTSARHRSVQQPHQQPQHQSTSGKVGKNGTVLRQSSGGLPRDALTSQDNFLLSRTWTPTAPTVSTVSAGSATVSSASQSLPSPALTPAHPVPA